MTSDTWNRASDMLSAKSGHWGWVMIGLSAPAGAAPKIEARAERTTRIEPRTRVVALSAALAAYFVAPTIAFGSSAPASASNNTGSAITAVAALAAAFLTGSVALLVNRQSRQGSARAAADAQLNEVRRRAAEDVRSLAGLGADLNKAVALVRDGPDQARREQVSAACSRIATELEFIWDEELRNALRIFSERAAETAVALRAEDLNAQSRYAVEAWSVARERAGILWRSLMLAAIDAQSLEPSPRTASVASTPAKSSTGHAA
jgi:hypothetical protein